MTVFIILEIVIPPSGRYIYFETSVDGNGVLLCIYARSGLLYKSYVPFFRRDGINDTGIRNDVSLCIKTLP